MSSGNASVSVCNGLNFILSSVDHPRLTKTEALFIRVFLYAYNQYATEVKEHAKQPTANDIVSTEISRPVNLKFCVDSEWVKSLIALKLLDDGLMYDDLNDERLQKYLDDRSIKSKEVVNLKVLYDLVAKNLRINVADLNSQSRIKNLFVSYHRILYRNGLFFLLKDNQKVIILHVLSAIRPNTFWPRLESDLEFFQIHNCKDFKAS